MTIDTYLADLRARLPRLRRKRFLAEAETHLRDSYERHRAAGLAPEDAERAAVADFGPAPLVARRVAGVAAVVETRLASALALGACALFVLPLYAVPENTLPPATWAEKPDVIAGLQLATIAAWTAALVLSAASALLAWTRWSRFAAPVLVVAIAALGVACVAGVVLVERWFAYAPATPSWPLLSAPLAAACLGACAVAAAWAARRRRSMLESF